MRLFFATLILLLFTQFNALAQGPMDDPYEQGILDAIKNIQSQNHELALDGTRDFIKQYPHSRLGQMLYADLLLAKAGPLTTIGSGIEIDRAIADFRMEIQQRWQHEADTTHRGLIPRNILFLADNQPYVILVDQQSSRVYVYRNEQGKPVLEADYFITIGIKGSGKEKRGDQKTPIGVYHFTRYIDGAELPDLYGAGAFPINYPNAWDKRLSRTGDGIWIHGTPSYTYNRSPLASNGCIVVSNPDFEGLGRFINPDINTPVVVAENIEWITTAQWQQQRKEMLGVLSSWVRDWESLDHERYRSNYSQAEFLAFGRDFKTWDGHKRWQNRNRTRIDVDFRDLNVYTYPGEDDLILMQYYQSYESNDLKLKSAKELYWRKEPSGWKIVYEGARSFPRPSTAVLEN